jgi:hypothetical protein
MYASNRSKTLTASVTAKVTADEKKRFGALAKAANLSPSEWCRQALIKAADCSSESRLLLSELLALRMIVLRLHIDLIEGDQPTKKGSKRSSSVPMRRSTRWLNNASYCSGLRHGQQPLRTLH